MVIAHQNDSANLANKSFTYINSHIWEKGGIIFLSLIYGRSISKAVLTVIVIDLFFGTNF